LATFAEIVQYDLKDNEGEDSYSLMPVIEENTEKTGIREATVHHSINGSFAIRKDDWKLIMCPGSGGWSFPRPSDKAAIDTLPETQLYNLVNDPKEEINLQAEHPEIVMNMKELLIKYIVEGRSTPGLPQQNDPITFKWKQIDFVQE
jgi:arylsulfatase A-like enzyme